MVVCCGQGNICIHPYFGCFHDELRRLSAGHPNLPELLVEYLIGNQDFY